MFLLGAAGFTASSVLCGLAPSTGVLIAARLVQGLAGAVMLPQGLGILREVFSPDELPKAFGVFGPVMGSAAMIGPILGGGLIALNLFGSGWRLVFLINLPVGLLAIAGAGLLLPRTTNRHGDSLDLGGAFSLRSAPWRSCIRSFRAVSWAGRPGRTRRSPAACCCSAPSGCI